MLNSAAFGGAEARVALEKSMFDSELNYIGIDWCVGGCQSYNDTLKGRQLSVDLKKRFAEWRNEHPKEYEKLINTK